jgi:hypothetical protein
MPRATAELADELVLDPTCFVGTVGDDKLDVAAAQVVSERTSTSSG